MQGKITDFPGPLTAGRSKNQGFLESTCRKGVVIPGRFPWQLVRVFVDLDPSPNLRRLALTGPPPKIWLGQRSDPPGRYQSTHPRWSSGGLPNRATAETQLGQHSDPSGRYFLSLPRQYSAACPNRATTEYWLGLRSDPPGRYLLLPSSAPLRRLALTGPPPKVPRLHSDPPGRHLSRYGLLHVTRSTACPSGHRLRSGWYFSSLSGWE